MNEEIEGIERTLFTLSDKLGRLPVSSPISKRVRVEVQYGEVYQRLVKLGARPQIRRKYRML